MIFQFFNLLDDLTVLDNVLLPAQLARVPRAEAVLPKGAAVTSVSWLLAGDQTGSEQDLNTPFAVAFALLGLVLAALLVASVVSALVVAGYRRIGILKSIGFTPGQVAASYLAQVAVPVIAGCAVGVVLGNDWVLPMLGTGAGIFHLAQSPAQYDVALRRGVSASAYARQLSYALGPAFSMSPTSQGPAVTSFADTSLIRLLTLMIAVLAAIAVINSLLMATRERVHDLGVFKALGMTPCQTITMVVCWLVVPAVGAAIIGVPFAIFLHTVTLSAIGNAAGTGVAANVTDIYGTGELLLLSLAALAVAAAGALLPASWAAASRTTAALHAE